MQKQRERCFWIQGPDSYQSSLFCTGSYGVVQCPLYFRGPTGKECFYRWVISKTRRTSSGDTCGAIWLAGGKGGLVSLCSLWPQIQAGRIHSPLFPPTSAAVSWSPCCPQQETCSEEMLGSWPETLLTHLIQTTPRSSEEKEWFWRPVSFLEPWLSDCQDSPH